jgi:hypothetical protein
MTAIAYETLLQSSQTLPVLANVESYMTRLVRQLTQCPWYDFLPSPLSHLQSTPSIDTHQATVSITLETLDAEDDMPWHVVQDWLQRLHTIIQTIATTESVIATLRSLHFKLLNRDSGARMLQLVDALAWTVFDDAILPEFSVPINVIEKGGRRIELGLAPGCDDLRRELLDGFSGSVHGDGGVLSLPNPTIREYVLMQSLRTCIPEEAKRTLLDVYDSEHGSYSESGEEQRDPSRLHERHSHRIYIMLKEGEFRLVESRPKFTLLYK